MTHFEDLPTHGFGHTWLRLSREARMVAYLAAKQKSGKVKLKELRQSERIRDALITGVDIDMKTGHVDWVPGTIKFETEEDFGHFCSMVRRFLEDEGVEFDLGKGALELIDAVDAKDAELRQIAKEQTGATAE